MSNALAPCQCYALAPSQCYALAPSQCYALVPCQCCALAPCQCYALVPCQCYALAPCQCYALASCQCCALAPCQCYALAPCQCHALVPCRSSKFTNAVCLKLKFSFHTHCKHDIGFLYPHICPCSEGQLPDKASIATSIRSSSILSLSTFSNFLFMFGHEIDFFGFKKCFINSLRLSFKVSNFVSGAMRLNTSLNKNKMRTDWLKAMFL